MQDDQMLLPIDLGALDEHDELNALAAYSVLSPICQEASLEACLASWAVWQVADGFLRLLEINHSPNPLSQRRLFSFDAM